MKLREFIGAVAPVLAMREERIAATAEALSAAGVVCDMQGECAPLDVARLLSALLGSHGPQDAFDSFESFAAAPLTRVEEISNLLCRSVPWNGNRGVSHAMTAAVPVEDWPVPDGKGKEWAQFSRSFPDALASLIEAAVKDQAELVPLLMVTVARAPHKPIAKIVAKTPATQVAPEPGGMESRPGQRAFIFAHKHPLEETDEVWDGVATGAAIYASTLLQIVEVLSGRRIVRREIEQRETA